jgi:hypothetical protein
MPVCLFPPGENTCPVCGLYTPNTAIPRNCRGEKAVDGNWTAAANAHGPGTELKKLLAGWPFFITSSPGCSCNRVAREMDIWGPDECEQPVRVDYVLAAMRENAEKRGLPFVDAVGRFLIKRAIKNARKNKIDH